MLSSPFFALKLLFPASDHTVCSPFLAPLQGTRYFPGAALRILFLSWFSIWMRVRGLLFSPPKRTEGFKEFCSDPQTPAASRGALRAPCVLCRGSTNTGRAEQCGVCSSERTGLSSARGAWRSPADDVSPTDDPSPAAEACPLGTLRSESPSSEAPCGRGLGRRQAASP